MYALIRTCRNQKENTTPKTEVMHELVLQYCTQCNEATGTFLNAIGMAQSGRDPTIYRFRQCMLNLGQITFNSLKFSLIAFHSALRVCPTGLVSCGN